MSKKPSHHEWLIVFEGNSDIAVYQDYLNNEISPPSFKSISTGGKECVLNMNTWNFKNHAILMTDLTRTSFKGVILVVDADVISANPFSNYKRRDDFSYIGDKPTPKKDDSDAFWLLDFLNGRSPLPVRGITVPRDNDGCLETVLLSAYGFPIISQPEYDTLADTIKRATTEWKIPDNNDGNPWWKINEKAKIDKFIYSALKNGFKTCAKPPKLPPKPCIIENILTAMNC
jgi:hypothetical protein